MCKSLMKKTIKKTFAAYLWPHHAVSSSAAISSDTLFGAVCWAVRILEIEDVGRLLEDFIPPRFAFSAPFPVLRRSNGYVRFYPKPLTFAHTSDHIEELVDRQQVRDRSIPRKAIKKEVLSRVKQISKVSCLSEKIFHDITSGKLGPAQLHQRSVYEGTLEADIEMLGTKLITYGERRAYEETSLSLSGSSRQAAVQHNHIDRASGSAAEGLLFYTQETFFDDGVGLWFLVRAEQKDMDDLILPALRYLSDTGLGADRTTGKGHFNFEITEAPQAAAVGDKADGWVSLSRYLPAEDEWKAEDRPLAYNLANLLPKREKRHSYMNTETAEPTYKNRVRMYEPGSVFPMHTSKDIYGRLALVVPSTEQGWPIYQSGLALGMPLVVSQ
jgi:CRISPR-associated protein Csm4